MINTERFKEIQQIARMNYIAGNDEPVFHALVEILKDVYGCSYGIDEPTPAERIRSLEKQVDDLNDDIYLICQRLNVTTTQEIHKVLSARAQDDPEYKTWIAEAIAVTGGERRRDYGRPLINFTRIALRWSAWLDVFVSPIDVGVMMIDTKIAREMNTAKDDNMVDIIGYTNCINDMDAHMKELGYTQGRVAFKKFDVVDMQVLYEGLIRTQKAMQKLNN